MRNLYRKLAVSNIRGNKPVYFPFLLTNILSVMVFFVMASIQNQEIIQTLPGSYVFVQFMKAGVVVTGVFAGVFLLYTNQLLIRQRKKELGLYNIFGLEKKHIAKVLGYESLFLTIIGILAGIVLGICLGKLFFLVLLKLLRLDSSLSFSFSQTALLQTIGCFAGVGILILAWNLVTVVKSKPVELLYAAKKGDAYHSFVALKALVGILCLAGAYALILTTPSPIEIIGRVISIALLILFGTMFFFSSCSVVLLQALKRNDRYYYKARNFISVSGLIYRLKQNAKGLSNICILSTIVMVLATTTMALYVGQQEMISFRFPMETKIVVSNTEDVSQMLPQTVHSVAEEYGVTLDREIAYPITRISGVYQDGVISVYDPQTDPANQTCGVYFLSLQTFNSIEGANEQLSPGEVLAFSSGRDLNATEIWFEQTKYTIKSELTQLSIQNKSILSSETFYYFIVPTQEDVEALLQVLMPSEMRLRQSYNMMFDASGENEQEFIDVLQSRLQTNFTEVSFQNADQTKQDDTYTYGGFLFIGLLLSLLFMIFLTLVVYYKQITEGYSDRYNYEVMQKVGLDRKEVSAVVHKQIRMMFFLPLLTAVVHLAVSLYAIALLLATLGLTNVLVLLLCAGAICVLFVLIYLVMYFSTARVYCKIVTR